MAKKTAKTPEVAAGTLVHMDPALILADDNIRYGTLPHAVENMMASIAEQGGVMVPLEAYPLPTPVNGHTHGLTVGFTRHAAALRLNAEQHAGLTVPVVIHTPADALDRLQRQIAENVKRESLSPMDKATAITKAEAAGLSADVIRAMFAAPGGRKGLSMQPASPSFITMHKGFLTLPKAIQAKIHDGRLGVAAAQKLLMVPAEEREAILASAEAIRLKAIDKEEAESKKLETKAEKEGAKEAKLTAATETLTAAEEASAAAKTAYAAAVAAQKAEKMLGPDETRLGMPFADWPEAEKTAKAERIGACKLAEREAGKLVKNTTNALSKAQQAHRKIAEPQEQPEPETKAPPAKAKKATVGPKDVQKAAAAAGTKGAKPVVLSAADARGAAAQLAKSRLAKVAAIGNIFGKVLSGELTPARAETELSLITGERVTKKA